MSRRPSRTARVLAPALTATVLLTCAACSDDDKESDTSAIGASPVAAGSPTPADRLTEAEARQALITETDLEDDWTRVKDAGTWRDSLLVGKVDVADFLTAKADTADCQRLLDGLYSDALLGEPSGASALTGFQEEDSRLLYQVGSYRRAGLDTSLAWLKSLPVTCDRFTATDSAGDRRTVQVTETSLPDEGDAREGVRVTVQGTSDGNPVTLTLDVAAVRVGADAITVTAGGLDGDEDDSVADAVRAGTKRLKDAVS
ncbi:hypothetical protein [Streptomyces sp. NPDC020489]|uniref:hypothetical protein n=1 Tax=Streptomyces sp. NPDC020489 TaxID=3365077 RepID=UPI0037B4B18B